MSFNFDNDGYTNRIDVRTDSIGRGVFAINQELFWFHQDMRTVFFSVPREVFDSS